MHTKRRTGRPAAANRTLSALLAPALLLATAGLAWVTLSQADFGFPWLYDVLEIDENVREYAPLNRYREGFENTTRGERLALFSGIVEAINADGRGLEKLRYRPGAGAPPVPMLREPEIVHLRDVARLVDGFLLAAAVAGVAAFVIVLVLARRRDRLAAGALAWSAGASLLAPTLLALAAFDATEGGWFSRLHELAFPPDHQWFFYYQESLMTTLMKAPEPFGPMATMLGSLTAAFFALALWATDRLLEYRH